MAKPFVKLTRAERIDPVWRLHFKPMLFHRLEELRKNLENPASSVEATASLRANIRLIRELLALETDPETTTLGDDRGSDD